MDSKLDGFLMYDFMWGNRARCRCCCCWFSVDMILTVGDDDGKDDIMSVLL